MVRVTAAADIEVGNEFTVDRGETWWYAKRVEKHGDGCVWIEAQNHAGSISSHTYASDDEFSVKSPSQ